MSAADNITRQRTDLMAIDTALVAIEAEVASADTAALIGRARASIRAAVQQLVAAAGREQLAAHGRTLGSAAR